MAEVQLIHLAQPTRYHELIGETIDPWCHIYMQKNWINKETSGYFRCHQNDQYGCLTEMYNLRNQVGENLALTEDLETDVDLEREFIPYFLKIYSIS